MRGFSNAAIIAGAVIGAAAIALPAAAQDKENASTVADALLACRSVQDNAERLACFDRTSAAFVAARDRRELVVLDREGARRAKRGVFGFSLPKIRLFGGEEGDEPEITSIETSVVAAQTTGYGLYVLSLQDNSTWQTTEARASFMPRAGDPIKIEAGMLGAYKASVKGGRSIPVKRLR